MPMHNENSPSLDDCGTADTSTQLADSLAAVAVNAHQNMHVAIVTSHQPFPEALKWTT